MTFSVAKLCPIKHWQAKCHKRRRQQVFDVLSMLCWKLNFLHLSSYHIKNYQDFLRKKNSCSLSFNPRQENDKMLQHRSQKQLFDVLSMLCWKLKFLLLSSYHNKKLLRFFLKKTNSCSLSFTPWQKNDKMLQHRRQKQLFDVLGMLFWKQISPYAFSYPSRIEQDYLQEKIIWDKLLRDKQ